MRRRSHDTIWHQPKRIKRNFQERERDREKTVFIFHKEVPPHGTRIAGEQNNEWRVWAVCWIVTADDYLRFHSLFPSNLSDVFAVRLCGFILSLLWLRLLLVCSRLSFGLFFFSYRQKLACDRSDRTKLTYINLCMRMPPSIRRLRIQSNKSKITSSVYTEQ